MWHDPNYVFRETHSCCFLALNMWPNPVKASIESLKILLGGCGNLLILQSLKTVLMCSFPCLLNLPPTNLGCQPPSSIFPCLLCMGSLFQIWPSKLPRLWTNRWSRRGSQVKCFWYIVELSKYPNILKQAVEELTASPFPLSTHLEEEFLFCEILLETTKVLDILEMMRSCSIDLFF